MKLLRRTSYAVQAVLLIAHMKPGIPVPCSRLASIGRMPERFLLQILRGLVTHEILKSVRGVEGGYMLSRPPEEITMVDVFEAIDLPIIPSVPPLEGVPACSQEKLLDVMTRAAAAARQELRGLTLADLMIVPPSELPVPSPHLEDSLEQKNPSNQALSGPGV